MGENISSLALLGWVFVPHCNFSLASGIGGVGERVCPAHTLSKSPLLLDGFPFLAPGGEVVREFCEIRERCHLGHNRCPGSMKKASNAMPQLPWAACALVSVGHRAPLRGKGLKVAVGDGCSAVACRTLGLAWPHLALGLEPATFQYHENTCVHMQGAFPRPITATPGALRYWQRSFVHISAHFWL